LLLLNHFFHNIRLVRTFASVSSGFNSPLNHRILCLSNDSADSMSGLLLLLSLNVSMIFWLWVWNDCDRLVLCSIRLVAQILGLLKLRDSGSSFHVVLGKLIWISNPFSLSGQSLNFILRTFRHNWLRILNDCNSLVISRLRHVFSDCDYYVFICLEKLFSGMPHRFLFRVNNRNKWRFIRRRLWLVRSFVDLVNIVARVLNWSCSIFIECDILSCVGCDTLCHCDDKFFGWCYVLVSCRDDSVHFFLALLLCTSCSLKKWLPLHLLSLYSSFNFIFGHFRLGVLDFGQRHIIADTFVYQGCLIGSLIWACIGLGNYVHVDCLLLFLDLCRCLSGFICRSSHNLIIILILFRVVCFGPTHTLNNHFFRNIMTIYMDCIFVIWRSYLLLLNWPVCGIFNSLLLLW